MRVAFFFDRDGTINEEVNYLSSPDQLRLLPRAAEALRIANSFGVYVFIISNQSGVARGLLTEQQVETVNQALLEMLKKEGVHVDGIYYCPHHPEYGEPKYRIPCDCRKPGIGMLNQAASAFPIDMKRSFVIGDKLIDVQTATNAGATGILVKTGYGKNEMNLLSAGDVTTNYIAEDSYDAVQYIKTHYRNELSLP